MTDPTKERPEWVYSRTASVLHRVARRSEICSRGKGRWWKESFLMRPRKLRMACGRELFVAAPGIFSRIGLKRCDRCCDAIGISHGHGCPLNDRECRRVK